ncbi:MAG: hypothetical protein OHK0021_08490 [Bryobacter sp.]
MRSTPAAEVIARLDAQDRNELSFNLETTLARNFVGRVLPFDSKASHMYAQIAANALRLS